MLKSALVAVLFTLVAQPLQAQGSAMTAPTVDLRRAARPALRLSALESCPLVFGSGPELPEGIGTCSGAIRLRNGDVVLVDGAARRILIFDSTGKLLRRVGRSGQGPGEFFGTPQLFPYRGDSLLLYNWTPAFSATFHVFSGSGVYARSFELDVDRSTAKRPAVVGASTIDGNIAVSSFAAAPFPQGQMTFLDSVRISTFDPIGDRIGNSAFVPDVFSARDVVGGPTPGSPASTRFNLRIRMVSAGPVSRAPAGVALKPGTLAVHGGPLYHFEEPNDVLAVHAPDGRVVRRILLPPLESRLRPGLNRILPQTEAQMLQLLSDELGRAWVEMARENIGAPRRWWIIDQSGTLVAEVLTPARQDVLFAGDGRVLLLRKDADDVQTVVQCVLRETTGT